MQKRHQINVDVHPDLKALVDKAAKAEDRTRNNWIYCQIKEALVRKGYKNELAKMTL